MTRLTYLALGALFAMTQYPATDASAADPASALDFEMKSLAGEKVDLDSYKGKVVMVVNTASRCGATPQYAQLQSLYEKHKDDGLVVLGFPCNQFGGQEPGGSEQIATFCEKNYGVTFPMFSKIDVNGNGQSPLYKYLKANAPKQGDVRWNFEKFLISKDGKVVERFPTGTEPLDVNVVKAIEAELKK